MIYTADELARLASGIVIGETRRAHAVTQNQMAELRDVSQTKVCRLEQGAHDETVHEVLEIARHLGIEPRPFFDRVMAARRLTRTLDPQQFRDLARDVVRDRIHRLLSVEGITHTVWSDK